MISNPLCLEGFHIEGLVSVSPKRKLNLNDEGISEKIQRLSRNIGINSKYVCEPGQYFSDLAQHGINKILDMLQLSTDDVDGLVLVTQSSDYIIPGTAVLLQDRCGFSNQTIAYDINLGCSGIPYGFFCGYGHLKSGAKRILIIGGDQSFSEGTTDEGHGVLFGDACSVASIVLKEKNTPAYFISGTDGGGYKYLYIPHGGKRRPINKDTLIPVVDETGVMRTGTDVVLDGPKILSFSVKTAPQEINRLLASNNWQREDVDYYFLHQANKMINETIRKKMKLTEDQCPNSLSEYGNTSVASPTVTMTAKANGRWNKFGAKSILCTFGIGLSWSSMSYVADGTERSEHIYVGKKDIQ
jgi:3-oxoacyl-[acyl-carrier-protein] synthase-3